MILFPTGYEKENKPIIAGQSQALTSNTTVTSENASFPAINMLNPNENQRWESSSADEQYITVTLSENDYLDYIAFAGHNFGDDTFNLSVETFDGTTWTERLDAQTVNNNKPVIMKIEPVICQGIRLKIGASTTTPTISVFYVGLSLEMERDVYVGHKPINYAKTSNVINGMSENGRFIGRIVVGENYNTDVEIDNIRPSFFREKINPFFVDSEEKPFFFAWRPKEYIDEVGFAWLRSNGSMTNQLSNGFVNISFPISAVVDGREITTEQPTVRTIVISSDVNDLNLRTLFDTLFPTPLDTTTVNVTVEAGVTIGATSTSNAAFDVGTWPSGTTLNMDLAGTIQGAGGAGGDAPDGEGSDGGAAIVAARAITIDLANGGSILDGAGGGAADTTNGGGGGSGSIVGAGGAADGGTAGNAGTSTTGGTASGNAGAGGNAGLAGDDSNSADGGDSGCTIDDNPLITINNAGSGTITGCNVNSPDFGSITIDITTDQVDYNLRTAYDVSNPTPNASTVVDVYVRNGVTISASDTATPAFDVGTWPVGATITLYVNGTIIGAGGAGGDAPDGAGNDGGDALVTTVPISIDFADQGSGADGLIASGGGGGEANSSGGGGGGAGDIVGSGGTGVVGGSDGTATNGGAGESVTESATDQTPTMTASTTSGVTITASDEFYGAGWEAFNDNIPPTTAGPLWHTGNTAGIGWLKIDFGSGTDIASYKLIAAAGPHASSSPRNWTFEGSNDDSSWTVLDTQSNETSWASNEERTYTLGSTETYRYYRFNITSSNDSTFVTLGEGEIISPAGTFVAGSGGNIGQDGYDNSAVQSGAGSGSAGNAIDGLTNVTKVNAGDGTITGPEIN